MQIRRAEKRDIPRLNDLLLQVDLVHHYGRPDLFKVGRKYTEEQLEQIIKNDQTPIFVAEDDEEVVQGYAFCVFKQFARDNVLTDIKTLYIDDLCVDENKRGRHIGTKLYEYVCSFAKESGCYNVTLNVWTCNPNAMAFYEKCGLKPQKIGMENIL